VREAGKLSAQFSVEEAEEYIRKHKSDLPAAMLSKLKHGVRACRNGVQRVHIIDGTRDEALLSEIFSNEGVGTMIHANEYLAIRPARKKDAGLILKLIRGSVEQQQLMPRTRRDLEERIGDFFVFEIDRNVVGCVGLKTYDDHPARLAELECLFVADAYENQGIGAKLMLFVEQQARERGAHRLFALSTQAFNYFQHKGGFKEGDPSLLPSARRAAYEQSGRRSKVLYKDLA
jgi:amino-acid N-acetyltransferase